MVDLDRQAGLSLRRFRVISGHHSDRRSASALVLIFVANKLPISRHVCADMFRPAGVLWLQTDISVCSWGRVSHVYRCFLLSTFSGAHRAIECSLRASIAM